MVAWSVSLDGGRTFADMGVPPLLPDGLYGDAGDPVLAVDHDSNLIYYAGTSERASGAYRGIPFWRSEDGGASFTRLPTIATNITSSDYPWIAVDEWPGAGRHDVYSLIWGKVDTDYGQWLMVSTNAGSGPWSGPTPIGNVAAKVPQMTIGTDHAAYVAWLEETSPPALQICKILNHGGTIGSISNIVSLNAAWVNGERWTRLMRANTSTDTNDYFKAYSMAQLAVNPDTNSANRSQHLYVTYADKGTGTTDRIDVYFTRSTNGGATWTMPLRVNTDATSNDQWLPSIAVRPDGNKIFIGWSDRRNDTNNSLIDVYGRWGDVAANGSVTFFSNDFRITTQSYPPAFAGTLTVNTNNGHYDPVLPPGSPEFYVNLHWWYPWFEEPPASEDDWSLGWNCTYDVYCHEQREHNGVCSDSKYVYLVWDDNRNFSQATIYPSRNQGDIRLARLAWPP
jgi:hypothetical protein